MNPQTEQNLLAAMQGEAFAYAKYMLFAQQARRHGLPDLALLFEQTAQVELQEHFAEEARLLGWPGNDAANLADAIKGESYEVETLYRHFADEATLAGDHVAAARFAEVREDERAHLAAFEAALDDLAVIAR